MKIVLKERARLRRAFLKKVVGRDPRLELLNTKEFSKAFLPLLPSLVANSVGAPSNVQLLLFVPGIILAMTWLIFVLAIGLTVESRWHDRQYLRSGRDLLSKEYRS